MSGFAASRDATGQAFGLGAAQGFGFGARA